jgi:Copper amine oxidase N-terminal domain
MRHFPYFLSALGAFGGAQMALAQWSMTVPIETVNGQPYVQLTPIASALKAEYHSSPENHTFNVYYQGRDTSLGEGPTVLLGDQWVPLSVSPYWEGSELMVPLDAIQKIFVVNIRWRLQARQVVFTPLPSVPPLRRSLLKE